MIKIQFLLIILNIILVISNILLFIFNFSIHLVISGRAATKKRSHLLIIKPLVEPVGDELEYDKKENEHGDIEQRVKE
jgi:hypothetical protein